MHAVKSGFGWAWAVASMVVSFALPANAQLRPLDPVDVRWFSGSAVHAQAGGAVLPEQYASLAGVRGRLWELGDFRVAIRTGRMIMELGGTVQRVFEDREVIAQPFGDARTPPADGTRHDAGDYRVAAILRLSGDTSRTMTTLRFGTRLPTTDNRVGLDRDMTDFFATLAAHRRIQNVALSAEAGVSINGTREPTYEQSDVLVYAVSARLDGPVVAPFVVLLGQQDFHDWAIRGNEDLAEIRAGIRTAGRRWLQAAWIHGLSDVSPRHGFQIRVGAAFGRP